MMLVKARWNEKQTFRLIPISIECPYNEVIYDPNGKLLAIISKDKKEKPQMFPKFTDKGNIIPKAGDPPYVQERRMMETYYEYYLEDMQDIKDFVLLHTENITAKDLDTLLSNINL